MKLGSQGNQNHLIDEENPYWISFSDIMSGLLVIFVLASLALILELTKTKVEFDKVVQELKEAEQVRRDIVREVRYELEALDIDVEITDNDTVIRVPDHLLRFESDQYRVPSDAVLESTVLQIGRVLHKVIVREERWRYLDTIFIEGHTDKRPSRRNMGNWGLSTYRAISVWNFWNERLGESNRLDILTNHNGMPLFSVSGYGATRPLPGEQINKEDFAKNRRIDFRITVRRPALEEFNKAGSKLGKLGATDG